MSQTQPYSVPPRPLGIALLLGYGAYTLMAQVIILREFLLLAQGVEVYLGLALWAWLFWTGLGSLVGGRLALRRKVTGGALLGQLLWLALWLPLTVVLARALPTLRGWPVGVAPTPARLVFWFLILCGPFCLASGLFFPSACSWLRGRAATAGLLGRAYGLDALGMSLGGLLVHVLLLGRLDSLALALGAGLLLAALLLWLLLAPCRSRWLLGPLLVLAALGLLKLGAFLPAASRGWQWPERGMVAVMETPSNVWTAFSEAGQHSLAANGQWYFTYPDPQTSEEQAHYALLQHPRPRRVLLLGGGIAGLAAEILRTPGLTRLDYVELDPPLLDLVRRTFPPEALAPLQDPRLRVVPAESRRFLRQGGEAYDVILLVLPEPRNARLNSFYTREFFLEVRARLAPDGVFSFGLGGSETSLSPIRARYLALMANTLRQVFPDVVVMPGLTWRFFASPQPGSLSTDPEVLLSRRQARGLELLYLREYYLQANLSPGRQAYARQVLSQAGFECNTDLHPLGLYYGLVLTGLEENDLLARLLQGLREVGPGRLSAGLALLTVGLWVGGSLAGSRSLPHLYSVFAMGLTVMGLELVILILFQITLGYLYGQLGLLLAAFMAGLAGGAFLAGSRLARGSDPRTLALASQGGLALLLAVLAGGLPWLLSWPALQTDGWGQLFYAAILIAGGGLSGMVFAAQGELCQRQGAALSLSAGRLYAVDLLGATLGTLGIGLLIIPCFGPVQALLLGAAVNASALCLLLGPPGLAR